MGTHFFLPCSEDLPSISNESKKTAWNKFCTVSEGVLVCAAHPINGTIIAGTKVNTLCKLAFKILWNFCFVVLHIALLNLLPSGYPYQFSCPAQHYH